MKVDERILLRIEALILNGEEVLKTRKSSSLAGYDDGVDLLMATQWKVSCLNILSNVFGKENSHFKMFEPLANGKTTFSPCKKCLGIMKAAKDDYENGYLFKTRTLIEAEVFDDLLEQSEHLLSQSYFLASAVIAGCVLEDALRKLCDRTSISLPAKATIEPMNVELAKAGIYNKLWQKKITALADLRNKAAHNLGGFTDKDVEDMIRDVRRFMEDYFS